MDKPLKSNRPNNWLISVIDAGVCEKWHCPYYSCMCIIVICLLHYDYYIMIITMPYYYCTILLLLLLVVVVVVVYIYIYIVIIIIVLHYIMLHYILLSYTPFRLPRRWRSWPQSTFCKGGVQWKQGVVIYMMLYTILLYNTTPIHCTPLRLHPPLMNTQTRTSIQIVENGNGSL